MRTSSVGLNKVHSVMLNRNHLLVDVKKRHKRQPERESETVKERSELKCEKGRGRERLRK